MDLPQKWDGVIRASVRKDENLRGRRTQSLKDATCPRQILLAVVSGDDYAARRGTQGQMPVPWSRRFRILCPGDSRNEGSLLSSIS